jgi:sporulation protein YlmC with PRC-barrel domain
MGNIDELQSWHGRDLIDRDGDEIGSIGDVYVDDRTGQPEWLTVRTGLFGLRETFVPAAEARAEGDTVRVPYEKSQVKDAPNVDTDGALSPDEESRLYRHYGLSESAGRDTASRETGRARLREHVVTENASRTVPVRGEERIELEGDFARDRR